MSTPSSQRSLLHPQASFAFFCGLICIFALSASVEALAGWVWREASLVTAIVYAGLFVTAPLGMVVVKICLSGQRKVLLMTAVLASLHFIGFALPKLLWETPPQKLTESVLVGQVFYYFGSASIACLLACVMVLKDRREVFCLSSLQAVFLAAGTWWVLREASLAGQVVTSIGMCLCLLLAGLCCFELAKSSTVRTYFFNSQDDHLLMELQSAKRVHESMFPAPIAGEDFRFGYAYRPMRQIGGDFIYIHHDQGSDTTANVFYLTIIDVTGHGITSALTVNRLHAELRQYFAKATRPCPSEALSHLNEYILLTMAEHGLFATAMCARLDTDKGEVTIANAGHPLCYLSDRDGLREVDSDGPMLGVFDSESFECPPVTCSFSEGDQLVMLTDGAIEARSLAGEMLGSQRLRQIIERSCRQVPPPVTDRGERSLLQKKAPGRLMDRADVRKPAGLIQQVIRHRMNQHPCSLADEIMLSIDDFVKQDYQDDILIATLELLRHDRSSRPGQDILQRSLSMT